MNSYLYNFTPHGPKKLFSQSEILSWLKKFHPENATESLEKYAIDDSMIKSRAHYGGGGIGEELSDSLFQLGHSQPTLSQRQDHLSKVNEEIFKDFYPENVDADHLIHVSCTFYESPTAAQKVISNNQDSSTTTTNMYHMGCYASLPSVMVASHLTNSFNKVDVIHSEFCSYHLDNETYSADQIIVKTLFADGAIKYSLSKEKPQTKSFKLLAQLEKVVPNTSDKMTWKIGDSSFNMTLSKRVPLLLKNSINDFFTELYESSGLNFNELKDESLFAIHPGGPKIIEYIQKELELTEKQTEHSKEVLYTRGNMSSATLPHIWNNILSNTNEEKYMATVAFGPGLTITGALFKICFP